MLYLKHHSDARELNYLCSVVLQLSIFGLALAWLYERTGSIWPTIAVHALNNAIAFALLTS